MHSRNVLIILMSDHFDPFLSKVQCEEFSLVFGRIFLSSVECETCSSSTVVSLSSICVFGKVTCIIVWSVSSPIQERKSCSLVLVDVWTSESSSIFITSDRSDVLAWSNNGCGTSTSSSKDVIGIIIVIGISHQRRWKRSFPTRPSKVQCWFSNCIDFFVSSLTDVSEVEDSRINVFSSIERSHGHSEWVSKSSSPDFGFIRGSRISSRSTGITHTNKEEMKRCSAFLLLCLFVLQVWSKGEVLNKNIVVAPVIERCKNLFPPNCIPPTAYAKVDAAHVPSDYQCPCKLSQAGDADNGGIDNPTGIPVQPNPDSDFFVDEAIASGFDNPVAVAFADNNKNMFVGERGGRIWNVDLSTGTKVISVDISKRVGFSGDRGLMDIKVHPTYEQVGHLMIMYTCDSNEDDGKEPDSESAENQKVVRFDINLATGIHPTPGGYEQTIIGGTPTAEGYASGVPLCFNTHALGEMFFGNDGSLMVTTGEGAHWNFDMGDWGQDADGRVDPITGNRAESLDAQCAVVFGPAQDIGSWRSQVLNSLAGKILRITPDAGSGICGGSPTGMGYAVKNPYCISATDPGTSDKSKVWATGLRNPFRMTMRPFDATKDANPGVFYFGDVGQGGYEEINAVTKPALNFGWPCWEGPLPSPLMRDSNYNDNPDYVFTRGCGGSAAVVAPCKNITTIARDEDGTRFTCPYVYKNKTTTLPFLYWTRYRPNDNAGYFTENAYTGQGYYGATTAGLAFYTGKKYPSKYQGKLFALDFTEKWVKVITHQDDQYVSTMHFAELIHTLPTEGAKCTLASGPDGNICYLTLNGGEVRCFRYVDTNVAPVPIASALETAVNADNAQIQFYADGTADREGDEIAFLWKFGDGTNSTKANPLHTYVTKGVYQVNLTATDSHGNKATVSIPVITNNARPKVTITSPLPNLPGNVFQLTQNQPVNFNMEVVDDGPAAAIQYHWEYKFVHNSHQHDKIGEFRVKTFTENNPPDESAIERNNLRVVATATDANGVAGQASILLSRPDWLTAFGNRAPRAKFEWSAPTGAPRVGQPVTFDARETIDQDGDYLSFVWTWGDGFTGNGLVTSHTYDVANIDGYVVTLNVTDNWGYSTSYTLTVPVTPPQAISPSSSLPAGPVYTDAKIVLSSIEPGAVIYYELFQGDSTGVDVSPQSPLYTSPLTLSYTAGVNATLLIKAMSASGGVPSATVTYKYNMVPPPCTTVGLGAFGTTAAPGTAFCVNPTVNGTAPAVVDIPAREGVQPPWTDGPPPETNGTKIVTFQIGNLIGTPAPVGTLSAKYNMTYPIVWINGGSASGAVIKMMVEFDFDGNSVWDRREIFNNIPPDDVPETWESSEPILNNGRFTPTSPTGTGYQPFNNGAIRIWFWEAIGDNNNKPDPLQIRTGTSIVDAKQIVQMTSFQFPYSRLYVASDRAPGTPLPGPPAPYTGSGWPSQPPVNTISTTSASSSATSAGTSATSVGTSGTAGTSSSIAGSSSSATGNNNGTTVRTSSVSATEPEGSSSSNSNIIICSFLLILLALL
eukprot:TRINITY_DN1356_c0_g1_i4.p1 TRINITY_DN1356_c0_g1~~TRINITY_DN1356_c0_g1_i4.p1  ORF type:complete len:1527 (-),score=390.45 TRINITY_DN1356_c0_g1_i4:27-4607(-)